MSEAPRPSGKSGEAPYWRRHYGIGQAWSSTDGGRRGCIWMLIVAMAVLVVVGLVAGLLALLG